MSLIRGMRSLSYGYTRDFVSVPETEENILSCIKLESYNEEIEYGVKILNAWPDFISLNARMIPSKISSDAIVERFENGKSLGRNHIYSSPVIYHNSSLKNPNSFCSKLTIKFENSGEYCLSHKKSSFFNEIFDEYQLVFDQEDQTLFEKKFLIANDITVEKFTKQIGQETTLEGSSEKAPCSIYPYGGFYEYGVHPQEIESCVFHINSSNNTSAIKISKLNFFAKLGVDPSQNGVLEGGIKFLGITNFSFSQKINLYSEILSGSCGISLTNRNTKEICKYKSAGLTHISNTDLITINFIKE